MTTVEKRANAAEERAKRIVKNLSTKNLVFQFELTETITDPNIYRVRGWLMNELEIRDPEAFEAWMDSDEESPRVFYIK